MGGGGGKRPPLPKFCHTYPTVMKLGRVILYLKKFQKLFESHDTPLGFCWHQHFLPEIKSIFLESLRVVLIKMVTILMMSAKMATSGLLKTKIFWKKGYDVIISAHDVIIPILSRDSNYNVNVVMWPKFGNSGISVREVIITSIL